ncbi:MAG: hypothetical protein PHT19_08890 [Methylococcus sp.]|nr:hypothetical protein [Methylococcus sp.]
MSAIADAVAKARTELAVGKSVDEELDDISKKAEAQAAEAQKSKNAKALRDAIGAVRVAFDQSGNARLLHVEDSGRLTVLGLESQAASDWIIARVVRNGGAAPSTSTLDGQMALLRNNARIQGDRVTVYVRVAAVDDSIFLDIGDPEGRAIVIGPDGWAVQHNSTVAFIRGPAYGELPLPCRAGGAYEAFAVLARWHRAAGVPREKVPAVIAAEVAALLPDGAAMILNFIGAAGSGKSTHAAQIVRTQDPVRTGRIPTIREVGIEHAAAAAQSSHWLVWDNMPVLGADQQNTLCRVVSGTEDVKRRLYTDGDVARLAVQNPVIVTSITPAITAPDAASRTIRVPFTRRREFRSDTEVAATFEAQRGELLGAQCDLLVEVLRRLPDVRKQGGAGHRTAGFIQVGECITQAIGQPPGAFKQYMAADRAAEAQELIEGDPFVRALLRVLKQWAAEAQPGDRLPPWNIWMRGTGQRWAAVRLPDGSLLIGATSEALYKEMLYASDARSWPTSARATTAFLTHSAPVLESIGIAAELVPLGGDRNRAWVFAIPAEVLT